MKTVRKLMRVLPATVLAAVAVAINGVAIASGSQVDLSLFGDTVGQDQSLIMAAVPVQQVEAAKPEGSEPVSEECQQFAMQPDADVGDVIRAGCKPTLAQMSALMDNPLGNVAMLFTQFDYYQLSNDTVNTGTTKNQVVYTGIFQFPKKLNDDWNLINRFIWTVPSVPIDQDKVNQIGGGWDPGTPGAPPSASFPIDLIGGRTTGLGDTYYVGLFAPSKGTKFETLEGTFLWGAGFDIAAPTGTEDVLTSNKWSAGPSALGVYMGPKWKFGALAMQYWSFAGDDTDSNGQPVADVNTTNLQYFVFYSVSDTSAIGASPNIIMNWEAESGDEFTVPIGIGYSTTKQFGKVPVRFGLEFHYNVVRPDNVGADYGVRFYVIPAAPSALFNWMG